MRKQIFVCLLLTTLLVSYQYPTSKAQVKTIKNGIELKTGELDLKAQFYANNIVRITKWAPNGTPEKVSLSVIKHSLPELAVEVEQSDETILLKSTKFFLKVSKADGSIEYVTLDNGTILKEKGKAQFTPVVYDSDSGFTVQQRFQLTANEGVYGLGEQEDGHFNYRGKKVVLAQANVGAANSFLVSTRNYGILWDNYSKTVFEDNADGASLWSDMGNNIDYYFVYGRNLDAVISGYRELTGKAPCMANGLMATGKARNIIVPRPNSWVLPRSIVSSRYPSTISSRIGTTGTALKTGAACSSTRPSFHNQKRCATDCTK